MNHFFIETDSRLGLAAATYLVQMVRYVVIAGAAFLIFYVLFKRKFLYKRIQSKFPERKKILAEIFYSLITFIVFALFAVLINDLSKRGYTFIYWDIGDYGWMYFFISIPLMLIVHDTYFYWTHRLMHHKKLFNLFHKVHHLSNNPSPWAAFSFHPLEAVIEAGILLVIVFIMPVHPTAIFIFLLIMTIMNVLGHLGYEIYPKGLIKHPLAKWNNTSTHHNMHHRLVKCNYGLYFNFWDRIMGTNHTEYEKSFEEVAARRNKNLKVNNTEAGMVNADYGIQILNN